VLRYNIRMRVVNIDLSALRLSYIWSILRPTSWFCCRIR